MRTLFSYLLGAALLCGADFFPLQPRNEWTYRSEDGGATTTIRVATTPFATQDGRVFHRMIGYAAEPLWVRTLDDGKLAYYDEETGQDRVLTDFGAEFAAEFRNCTATGKPERPGVIIYTSSCADAGLEREVYQANIGLVERTEQTLAGPRTRKLVAAKVGQWTLGGQDGSLFQVQVARKDATTLTVTMRLNAGPAPYQVTFPTGQTYDVVLRDPDGAVVWRWSEGQAFLQMAREEEVPAAGLRYAVDIPLALQLPRPWKDGVYTVEAWLTAGASGREFAGAARIPL
jgi:hypothetical protein